MSTSTPRPRPPHDVCSSQNVVTCVNANTNTRSKKSSTDETRRSRSSRLLSGSTSRRLGAHVVARWKGCGDRSPFARLAVDLERATERLHAIAETDEARASTRVCSADPVIAYRQQQQPLIRQFQRDVD